MNVDIGSLDVDKEVMIPAKRFWTEISGKNKKNNGNSIELVEDDVDGSMSEDQILNDFKESC